MTKKQEEYFQDHKLAKLVCFLLNTVLFMIYFSIDSDFIKNLIFLIANFTYFFGVNSIAYIVESIRNHNHKHDII